MELQRCSRTGKRSSAEDGMDPTSDDGLLTIGRLARRCGVARSALLYYDRIGLLKPVTRSDSRYRLYPADAADTLQTILDLRQAGLSTDTIAACLRENAPGRTAGLMRRLHDIHLEMERLRHQQALVLALMGVTLRENGERKPSGPDWEELLRKAGVTRENAHAWHDLFERQAPAAHLQLLEGLGFTPEEARSMRARL